MSVEKVLVIDDELLIRTFLKETLTRKGLEVTLADNGKTGIALAKEGAFDLVFTDMKMPDITGLEVLRKIKELSPSTIVIVITAFGSIDNAVEAMRLGAFNYLIKPFSPDTIEAVIEKAKEHSALVEENRYLRQQVSGSGSSKTLIAHNPTMKQILEDIQRIAKSNASVMITGESGTGKEVFAHAIHYSSPRANKPFIRVNCAAIPESLVESEFFGHEKGAFTGANLKRSGRFELAHEGTLLLDEITEVPIGLQAKLLRAIQEQEFERVGGSKPIKVDVRLISTSNRNIQEAIKERVLREDLYYRLNVVPIHIPPLRERKEDIIPIAEHFLNKLCNENHKKAKSFTSSAKKKLLSYEWPGNVRELGNIVERAVVLDLADDIGPEHLHIETAQSETEEDLSVSLPKGITLRELEKRYIVETLQAQRSREDAAKNLGIDLDTLKSKMKEYKVK